MDTNPSNSINCLRWNWKSQWWTPYSLLVAWMTWKLACFSSFYVGSVCWVCKTFIKPSLSINRQSDSTKKKVERYQIGTSKNIHFPITVKKRWLLLRLPYLETLIVHPLSWDMFSSQHLFNLFRLVEKQQSLVIRILMFNSFKVVVVSY